jgi:hypothetical protein
VALSIDAVTFDCADPLRVATFWAAALERQLDPESDDDGALVHAPAGTSELGFQPVPEAKVVKNRLHIDLRPTGSMAAEVERLHGLGATTFPYVEEGGRYWTVMHDVEGNEFCVLRSAAEGAPRSEVGIDSVVFDCTDPFRVADFWCAALGFEVGARGDVGVEIRGAGGPMLSFVTVPEPKAVKNRLHLDLRPTGSMAAEVERLEGIGASIVGRVDVEGSFWTVMQDPEGDELCVLRGPEDGWTPEG